MRTISCYLEHAKLTKGAVQFKEPSQQDDPLYLIGTLYLRKAGLATADKPNEYPTKIMVTVSIPEDMRDHAQIAAQVGASDDA